MHDAPSQSKHTPPHLRQQQTLLPVSMLHAICRRGQLVAWKVRSDAAPTPIALSFLCRALKQLYAFRPFSGPTVKLPPEIADPEEGGISSPFQEQSQEAGPQEQQLYKSPTAPAVPLRQRSIFDTPPPSPPP